MCVFGSDDDITVDGRSYSAFEFMQLPEEEQRRLRAQLDSDRETQEKRKQFLLTPPAPSPLARIGPRIGVESVSKVKAGQRGAQTTVSDLKIGRPE